MDIKTGDIIPNCRNVISSLIVCRIVLEADQSIRFPLLPGSMMAGRPESLWQSLCFSRIRRLLIGVMMRNRKLDSDEAHDVPAARQMLEPVMRQPMLIRRHPPLVKQFIGAVVILRRRAAGPR